jgi:polar amino acid transport system ATP-binding protein
MALAVSKMLPPGRFQKESFDHNQQLQRHQYTKPGIINSELAYSALNYENCSSMEQHLIEVEGLKKSFQGNRVLNGINLRVDARQLTVLIGPSGCGKSTLLRCLNGLEDFDEGRITIGGLTLEKNCREYKQTAHKLRMTVGLVFQSFNLFPHLSVLDNVAYPPMIVKKLSKMDARAQAMGFLEKVGLREKAEMAPEQLSGGQQQRAAIARALAMKPKVILYDEPTSALDPALVDEVLDVMKGLHSEGITQIVVTHEMRFARDAADKIAFMYDGAIVEEGTADVIFSNPADSRTRQFLRRFL